MRKVASYADFKRLKSLSFNDFNRWVITLYQQGYEDGQEELKDEIKNSKKSSIASMLNLRKKVIALLKTVLGKFLKALKE